MPSLNNTNLWWWPMMLKSYTSMELLEAAPWEREYCAGKCVKEELGKVWRGWHATLDSKHWKCNHRHVQPYMNQKEWHTLKFMWKIHDFTIIGVIICIMSSPHHLASETFWVVDRQSLASSGNIHTPTHGVLIFGSCRRGSSTWHLEQSSHSGTKRIDISPCFQRNNREYYYSLGVRPAHMWIKRKHHELIATWMQQPSKKQTLKYVGYKAPPPFTLCWKLQQSLVCWC